MRNKIGTLLIVLGAGLVLAALSLFLYNQREAGAAEDASLAVLPELVETIQARQDSQSEDSAPLLAEEIDPTMTEVEIDGYNYIGYLSIPALELDLPIMSEWDYTRLKIAPCRFSGSTKTNDLVIAGHRYARHFSPIERLSLGDDVYFTDMDGIITHYQVAEVNVIDPTAVEEVLESEFDLVLFTCTYGGASRVVVSCAKMEVTADGAEEN